MYSIHDSAAAAERAEIVAEVQAIARADLQDVEAAVIRLSRTLADTGAFLTDDAVGEAQVAVMGGCRDVADLLDQLAEGCAGLLPTTNVDVMGQQASGLRSVTGEAS